MEKSQNQPLNNKEEDFFMSFFIVVRGPTSVPRRVTY